MSEEVRRHHGDARDDQKGPDEDRCITADANLPCEIPLRRLSTPDGSTYPSLLLPRSATELFPVAQMTSAYPNGDCAKNKQRGGYQGIWPPKDDAPTTV